VDKPVAGTAAEARELAALAEERGLLLSVFQNRRWDNDFRTLAEMPSARAMSTWFMPCSRRRRRGRRRAARRGCVRSRRGPRRRPGSPCRPAAAAAWKQDGQEGGYVPGTDPASPDGIRAPGASEKGAPPVRGDKGPANHVRTDTGAGPHRADGAPGTKAEGDGKGSKDAKAAKGSTGTSGSTEKSGSGSKAPAASGSGGSAKAPATDTAPQSQPTTQPKSAPAVVYSGVSGPECPTQRFQRDGYYNDGKEGWATHSGGFGGYGCAGKYLSMPMSGSSSKDSGGSATWLFDLPDSARKCSISVHVPGSSDIVRVGGNPSHYTVYDRFLPRSNNLVGSFSVNQQSRRGTWYNVPGTFPVDAKKLSVRIHDRGQDSHYEHHAISAIKATCTG
ncbi:hypothetical protein, partial [Streptomyces sp. AS13]|uniref:hypothetical protein n=1 Tax=Streptomyces sp. AS13 TaxID=3038080 RepID=UPI00278BCCC0